MDKLPLEIKQRICSFLHSSPQLLKIVRLVSTDFASAAAPYLIPRVFLFKHPFSCRKLRSIVEHPIFSKHLTTLVVDPSNLKKHNSFQAWLDDHEVLQEKFPSWWDFKPEDIEYDEDGDPMLFEAQSRTKWLAACGKFDAAVKKLSKQLKDSHEHHWRSQQNLATYLSSKAFRRELADTIANAFWACPNLVNIVIADPEYGPKRGLSRKMALFRDIYPHPAAWIDSESHDPSEFGLLELMSAVNHQNTGLNSLTIIELPFNCAEYSMVASLESLKSLKHIRISYRYLMDNPTTKFGFNLEEAIRQANVLETLWLDMPPLVSNIFDGDAMLLAINSKSFRDIILHNVTVSEDLLVDFLLRNSQSLQQLSIGVTLKTGTWVSVFHRIKCQMTALERMQIAYIRQRKNSDIIDLSSDWWMPARDFVFEGGELLGPSPRHEERDTANFRDCYISRPSRSNDLPEKGLWKEYDAKVSAMY